MRTLHPVLAAVLAIFVSAPLAQVGRHGDPALRIELNIPAYRLEVWNDTVRVATFGVAVGAPEFPTPRGEYAVTEITWNPWWYPPPSEWAKEDTVTPPGPGNPMGRVKLRLAGGYLIHGTPLDKSIGSAASHGCIRMHNADVIALARLLQEHQGLVMTDTEVERLLAARTTRVVPLPDSVPVTLVYRTADVMPDTLALYPDIYRLQNDRQAAALAALDAAGVDTAFVDSGALARHLRAARARVVRVPLDSLGVAGAVTAPTASGRAAAMPDETAGARAPGASAGAGCVSP